MPIYIGLRGRTKDDISAGFIAWKEGNSNSKFKSAFNEGWVGCSKLATKFNA